MSLWVKICGIRDVATARSVAALGADAIGLNFYPDSPRVVSPDTAAEIVAALSSSVTPVGVFVNHTPDEVRSICRHVGLSTVQLHGDETPQMMAELDGLQLIRAFRVRGEDLRAVAADLRETAAAGVHLTACLLDAHVPGSYGGTGQCPPWQVLADGWDHEHWPAMILAGGLTPENVADGVRTVRPWGVDVASGVESSPGEKDLERVRRFITSARNAPSSLNSQSRR